MWASMASPSASSFSTLSASPFTQQPRQEGGYDDASAEIADIVSWLHALQNFLKSAKASRP